MLAGPSHSEFDLDPKTKMWKKERMITHFLTDGEVNHNVQK